MKWIGLTGGIATGKSTVKKLLIEQNVAVIDADAISHELTQVDAMGYKSIVSQFGNEILNPDQSLNRQKLADVVFNDPQKLLLLESLLHPLIQAEVQVRRSFFKDQSHDFCFYDVPLLFEKKLETQFDSIVVVYASLTTQIERIMLRNNLTHTQALARINAQIPIAEKIHRAHYCLDNSTTTSDLELQVKELLKRI